MVAKISDVVFRTSRKTYPKRWGYEEWIVNNDLYCGKRLHFTQLDGSTSLHFHVKKHETMYVESGFFEIIVADVTNGLKKHLFLYEGDSVEIVPYLPHRIIAREVPAVLVEFSTHHDDDDSCRVEA